jgi:hypothetical protein
VHTKQIFFPFRRRDHSHPQGQPKQSNNASTVIHTCISLFFSRSQQMDTLEEKRTNILSTTVMADTAATVDDVHTRERRNHRLSKRRKIAVACDECRNRKVRCDGVQPGKSLHRGFVAVQLFEVCSLTLCQLVCGACARRSDHGIHCIYTVEPEKKRAIRK